MAERRIGNLRADYDEQGDILYLSLGDPEALPRSEEGHGFIVGRKNGNVVAVTILDYEDNFRKMPDLSWLYSLKLPQEMLKYLEKRPEPPK